MSTRNAALRLIGVGFFIVVCILLGVLAGLWLDSKLGTSSHIFALLGVVAGIAIAAYGVYRMLLPLLGSKHNGGDN